MANGWPKYNSQVDPAIRVYWDFKEELRINDEILLEKDEIIITKSMRTVVLEAVHQPHLGIKASKRRVQEVVYWPDMCKDVEGMVKQCAVCNSNQNHQKKSPLYHCLVLLDHGKGLALLFSILNKSNIC